MGINVWLFSMGILNREFKTGNCMGILKRVYCMGI